MSETKLCIAAERIGDLADLPEGHPDRLHARDCPRCRGLWLSYQSFLTSEPAADAGLESARARLDAFIRAQGEKTIPAPEGRGSPWRRFFSGLARPMPAFAALAIVLVAALVLLRSDGPGDEPRLRNAGGGIAAVTAVASVESGRSVRVSWDAVPGAGAYQVRFFGADLADVLRSGAIEELEFIATADRFPADATELTCRVYALRDGDVIAVSRPVLVRLP